MDRARWTRSGGAVSLRALYAVGFGYLLVCAGLVVVALRQRMPDAPGAGSTARPPAVVSLTGDWFATMKPYCNAVEVETRMAAMPAPPNAEGAGYKAACYALAGKIVRAQQVIDALSEDRRYPAAAIVFNVGHPVADQGDDQSAGPIMRLVLRYWPNNYMALYHAGMSEYVLGDAVQGRAHLEAFLGLYHVDDGFTRRAKAVLAGQAPLPGSHE